MTLKNKKFIGLAILSTLVISAGIISTQQQKQVKLLGEVNDGLYSLILNTSNKFTGAEALTTHVVQTTSGNNVEFNVSGGVANPSYFLKLNDITGSYFETRDNCMIKGITSMTFNTNVQDARFKLSYGMEYGNYTNEVIFRKGNMPYGGWEDNTYTINLAFPANYFRFENIGSVAIYIRSLNIKYSCEETTSLNYRDYLESRSGDLLAGSYDFGGSQSWNDFDKKHTTNLAYSDSGYALKLGVVDGEVTGSKTTFIVFNNSFSLVDQDLVFVSKSVGLFPEFQMTLLDSSWNALTNAMTFRLASGWIDQSSYDAKLPDFRSTNFSKTTLSSNTLADKTLSAVSIIKFDFSSAIDNGIDSKTGRMLVIDRIVKGNSLFGFSGCRELANSYVNTNIPLNNGSTVPSGKHVEFKMKAIKNASNNYKTNCIFDSEAETNYSFFNSSGLANFGSKSLFSMKMVDDGYYLVRLDASLVTGRTNLVFNRYNLASGFIKDICLVDAA